MDIPEMPFFETYLIIASLMANCTVLLRGLLEKGLYKKIWFIIIVILLSICIPFFLLCTETAYGSFRAIHEIHMNILFPDRDIQAAPAVLAVISDFTTVSIISKILIADAAGILAGFGIWYYVKKKIKTAASE